MSTKETTDQINAVITDSVAAADGNVTSTTSDPIRSAPDCNDIPISASEGCNMLAAAESKGSGSYTALNASTGAAGRYQFIPSTAIEQIKQIRDVKDTEEARTLWNDCGSSSTPECKKLQDEMCKNYFGYIERSLKNGGIPLTNTNRYLAWNQGTGGARAIIRSIESGQPVSNPRILKNMQRQAWDFSADGKEFYNNMENYLQERGIDIT